MFNDNSIIKEVNIINKVICYLLVIVCLMVCNEGIFLLFVDLFLLLITKQDEKLFKISIVNTILIVLSIFFPQFLWITCGKRVILYVNTS